MNFRRFLCGGLFLLLLVSPEEFHGERMPQKEHERPKKFTENEKQALRLLELAKAASAQLQPDVRAFLLWRVAEAYKKVAPAKRESLLRDAFNASVAIEDITPDWAGCVNKMQG